MTLFSFPRILAHSLAGASVLASSMNRCPADEKPEAAKPAVVSPSDQVRKLFEARNSNARATATQERIQHAVEDDFLKIVKANAVKEALNEMYSASSLDPRKGLLVIYVNDHLESCGLKKFLNDEKNDSKAIIAGLEKKYNVVCIKSVETGDGLPLALVCDDPLPPTLIDIEGFAHSQAVSYVRNAKGSYDKSVINLDKIDKLSSYADLKKEMMILMETAPEHHFSHTSFPVISSYVKDRGFMNYLKTVDPKMHGNVKALSIVAELDPNNSTVFANNTLVDSDDPMNAHIFQEHLDTPINRLIVEGVPGSFHIPFTNLCVERGERQDGDAMTLKQCFDKLLEAWNRYKDIMVEPQKLPNGGGRWSSVSGLSYISGEN